MSCLRTQHSDAGEAQARNLSLSHCAARKNKDSLVKTIQCNLTKMCQIFVTFTESYYRNMGTIYLNDQEFSPVYRRIIRSSISPYMFEALSFLVYKSEPHSKGCNSISILYFSLCLVPV